MIIRFVISGKFPGWLYFIESAVSVLLWPVVTWILLAPQRRAIDRDHTRPI
jgi:rod shape-determining protein MreD